MGAGTFLSLEETLGVEGRKFYSAARVGATTSSLRLECFIATKNGRYARALTQATKDPHLYVGSQQRRFTVFKYVHQ